jgi:hypothetical protein
MYDKDEQIVARKRDLYILENHNNGKYKLNFEWTDNDITYWKKYFEIQ